ncbi:MAG: alanine racemase [Desulfopila sp.]
MHTTDMDTDTPLPALTQATIDLAALAHNYRELRRITTASAKMMAVIKANAYGHGAAQVARVALANGADFLAVARVQEAVQLRESGVTATTLLLGYCDPRYVPYLAAHDIIASIGDMDSARALSKRASQAGVRLKAHVKVDTGMGRVGIVADALSGRNGTTEATRTAAREIIELSALPGLEIEGIYTHFASADSRNQAHARQQLAIFQEILAELATMGFTVPYTHAANSAALITMPESHLSLVRPGIAQYGLWPSAEIDRAALDLRPVMSLRSRIVQIKEVPAGFAVSYGSTYTTTSRALVATVPVGYADGYSRLLSGRGAMLVRGQRAPVIGRVCMDFTMIDVSGIEGVRNGDPVVVFGRQGEATLPVDELAALSSTINYEIVSTITSRVIRCYQNANGASG